MPCSAGHAPVASVARVVDGNVLAKCRQSGKYAPEVISFRNPPLVSLPQAFSRKSGRKSSIKTNTNRLGRGVKAQFFKDIPPIIDSAKVRRQMSMKKSLSEAGLDVIVFFLQTRKFGFRTGL